MRLDIAAQTDVGRRKKNNEDFYGIFREGMPGLQLFQRGALLCVADGLGGHVGGEIASRLAVALMKDMLNEGPPPPPEDLQQDEGPLPVIREWIRKANDNIFQTNRDHVHTGRPMGTTLLAALVTPKKVFIGNVGDSRCYHIRDGDIIGKTEDHSWVDEQVKMGLMSKAEAESDSRRNLVTRSVGTHPLVPVDTYIWHIVPGDMLLLCTDGLVNMVRDPEISAEFKQLGSPADIAHRLIDLANDHGGKDNITVLVADISPSLPRLIRRRLKAFWRRYGVGLFWLLLTLLFGAVCLAVGYYLGLQAK